MYRLATVAALTGLTLASCGPAASDAESPPLAETSPTTRATHMPTDADRDAILTTVQALFDALRERDGSILREIHPLHLVRRQSLELAGTRPAGQVAVFCRRNCARRVTRAIGLAHQITDRYIQLIPFTSRQARRTHGSPASQAIALHPHALRSVIELDRRAANR